jgi:hypothetical protein
MTAFVLGNGTSRKDINPQELKQNGTVYGCNALYREFDPDYLIAVDVKMVNEINTEGYQNKHTVWTNYNRTYKDYKNFNYFEKSKGWSSGPTALWLASQHEHREIYILGFDYQGLKNGKMLNNLYADTKNYKKSNETATFYGNWLRQTEQVIKENQHIKYIRVIASDNFEPKQLNNFRNFKTIFIEDLARIFNLSPHLSKMA